MLIYKHLHLVAVVGICGSSDEWECLMFEDLGSLRHLISGSQALRTRLNRQFVNVLRGPSTSFNATRTAQNGRCCADDIFKRIYFNEKVQILPKFHWNMIISGQLRTSQRWVREWHVAEQATRHYLNQCRNSSRMHTFVAGLWWINTKIQQKWFFARDIISNAFSLNNPGWNR